jgi:hypothetical protein
MSDEAGTPRANFIHESRNLHIEIIDTDTRQVWQALDPCTREEFQKLSVAPPFAKVGIGRGSMDRSYFSRSPDAAQDGPMLTREFDGRVFSLCARPGDMSLPSGPEGPRQVSVYKHHVVIYQAGRELDWLHLPDGSEYVQVIDGAPDNPDLVLPDGWTTRTETLTEELAIELPYPATVFFFKNGESFQGPVRR